MSSHLVATAYIVHEGRVLLVFHKKLQKWLPAGGHVEPGETADQAAVREVREELGISVELVSALPAPYHNSLPLPFDSEVHNVGDHDHWSLDFLAKPLAMPTTHNAAELDEFRWFSRKELAEPIILPGVRARALRALELV